MSLTFIREATVSDLTTLRALMQAFYTEEHLAYDEAVEAAAAQLVATSNLGRCGLLYCDEALAGYAVLCFGYSLEFHGRYGLLDELYVSPSFRNQGMGRFAINWAVSQCKEAQIAALRLEVSRANSRAAALYQRLGFSSADRDYLTCWVE